MAKDWFDYQEEAAECFRLLGLEATTNASIEGVRTKHDVDVLVLSHHAGFDIKWIVECKYWKTPISKVHVLALRQIVIEVGADRGILLSESGFQSGAKEAANLTNVQVTSLEEIKRTSESEIYSMRLRELYDRIQICNEKYWNISKEERIKHGLRFGAFGPNEPFYSGARVVEVCSDVLSRGFREKYPITSDYLNNPMFNDLPKEFHSPQEIAQIIEPLVSELEEKLSNYETIQNGT